MRELKFRAWDEQQKIMHYNFQWIKSGEDSNDWIVFTSDKNKLSDKLHPLENPHFSQQFKIMQWTGINNIYEGDIVDFGGVGVVKYEDDRFFVDCGNLNTRVSKNHKVVGNIYENENITGKKELVVDQNNDTKTYPLRGTPFPKDRTKL